MELRRRILKCLLVSLALAAIAGVAAVLLPGREVMVKVMFTGLVSAVAAGILIAFSFIITRPISRPGGLFGMAAVLVEFVLCVGLIWLTPVLSSRTEEKIALTIGVVALTSLPTIVYLAFLRRDRMRLACVAGAATAAAALVLYLVATWMPGNPSSRPGWWGTAWTTLGYGILVFACLAGVRPGVRDVWRWAGTVATVIGAAALMALVWRNARGMPRSEAIENIVAVFTSLGALTALAALTLLPDLKPGQRWVRIGTIGAAAATALFVDALVIDIDLLERGLFERLLTASAIVTGCGSLALVVLAALNRRGAIEPSAGSPTEIVIICPVCRTKQSVPSGVSACKDCGLRMEIKIEEPRCPSCDYLLYRLKSDRCPECGAQVRRGG